MTLKALLLELDFALHTEHVGLPPCSNGQGRRGLAGRELRDENVTVLVDLDLRPHGRHLVRDLSLPNPRQLQHPPYIVIALLKGGRETGDMEGDGVGTAVVSFPRLPESFV